MTSETSSNEQFDETSDNTVASDFARALHETIEAEAPSELEKTNTDAAESHESASKTKPETLDDLAKALNVEVSDLYSIAVPRGSGQESLTLGAMKDRFDEWSNLDSERVSWNEERTRRDNELYLARQELEELLTAIPKEHVSKDVLNKAATKVQQRIHSERARTLDAIPEWKDEARRSTELTGIASMLEQYGLPANYLGTVYDHRIMRFLRDAHRREVQVQAALSKITQQRTKTSGASKANGAARKPTMSDGKPERSHDARGALITALRDKAGI